MPDKEADAPAGACPLSRDDVLRLASTHAASALPEDEVASVLSAPPFVPTRSLINIRDVGAVPGSAIPAGRVYRSGALGQAAGDPEAVAWLSSHVRAVFDLRRDSERERGPDPVVDGVRNAVGVGAGTEGEYPHPDLADFVDGDGSPAWAEQMMRIALMYRPTIRALLEHVRDRPEDPLLFHCTAGRDRTGVVAGLLLALAGTDPDVIVYDFLLSRIGTEPARELLVKYAMAAVGADSVDAPGFLNFVSLRAENWNAFVDALHARFGGWDGYVTDGLGFSAGDLETIKRNLRT